LKERKEAKEKKEKALSGELTKRQGQQGETEQKKMLLECTDSSFYE
jgi:hypothetical protein